MRGACVIFHPGDVAVEVHVLTAAPDLDYLKNAVGGWIEAVPYFSTIKAPEFTSAPALLDGKVHQCIAYCNEEGKLEGLPINDLATLAWDTALRRIKRDGKPLYPTGLFGPDGELSDALCGSIIVLWGDEEFMDAQ